MARPPTIHPLAALVAACCVWAAGCGSQPARVVAEEDPSATAIQLYVSRALQDTPDPFLDGVEAELRERFVLNGYDSTGVARGLEGEELLEHLAQLNAEIPGTAALHLRFVEAPLGLGKLYAKVRATVYDPRGRVLLLGDLEPPPRSIPEVIFPLRRPEAAGRRWCEKVWRDTLSLVLSPRG